MPYPKPSEQDLEERKERAEHWRLFRRNNLLTQRRLATELRVSRRTIQQIENGHVTPHIETLRRFAIFKRKYDRNSDLNLRE